MILYKYVKQDMFMKYKDEYLNGKLYFADKQIFDDVKEREILNRFNSAPARFGEPAYDLKKLASDKQYLDKFKICCLTELYDNNAMWASYTQNHGVCIEIEIGVGLGAGDPHIIFFDDEQYKDTEEVRTVFDMLSKDSILAAGLQYPDDLPSVQYQGQITLVDIQTLFYYKDCGFRHEKEHRLLIYTDEPGMHKVGTVRKILFDPDFPSEEVEKVVLIRDELCRVTRLSRYVKDKFVRLLVHHDQLFTWAIDSQGAMITKYNDDYKKAEYEIVIPTQYQKNPVVAIGDDVFKFSNITKVVIPDSVKTIGRRAFWGCIKLKEIKLPKSLHDIGESVFKGCTALPNIDIPEGVVEIQWWSFEGCISLTKVVIPDSVTEIGGEAFKDCIALKEVKLGKRVELIDERAFYDCEELPSIYIPKSVKKINEGVFSNCSKMTEINGDPTNEKYGYENGLLLARNHTVLQCCPCGKRDVSIPASVLTIEQEAFCGCINITKVVIPSNVEKIKKWAFEHCVRLSSVVIPDTNIKIDVEAFFECDARDEESHNKITAKSHFKEKAFGTAKYRRGNKR